MRDARVFVALLVADLAPSSASKAQLFGTADAPRGPAISVSDGAVAQSVGAVGALWRVLVAPVVAAVAPGAVANASE